MSSPGALRLARLTGLSWGDPVGQAGAGGSGFLSSTGISLSGSPTGSWVARESSRTTAPAVESFSGTSSMVGVLPAGSDPAISKFAAPPSRRGAPASSSMWDATFGGE